MKTQLSRALATILMVLFSLSPAWATCGGGGGGGTGGVGGGGRSEGPAPTGLQRAVEDVGSSAPRRKKGLVLYWFPRTQRERQEIASDVVANSHTLLSAVRDDDGRRRADMPELQPIIGDSAVPVAVLATADGSPIKKVENTGGKLKPEQVEKLVEAEMKQRETSLDTQLKDCEGKSKSR